MYSKLWPFITWISLFIPAYCVLDNLTHYFNVGLDENLAMTTTDGDIFLCQIVLPRDEFEIEINGKLPNWLLYDATSKILKGTPGKGDAGVHNIELSLMVNDSALPCKMFSSIMSIDVEQEANSKNRKASCKSPPQKLKPFNYLEAQQGQTFQYNIKSDTFYDAEDGNTQNLKLRLTTVFSQNFPRKFWLQLDATRQVLYGLPMTEDDVDTLVVQLIAEDSCGQRVKDAISLDVKRVKYPVLYSFVFRFDEHFKQNLKSGKYLFKVVEKLLLWFSRKRNSDIIILDVDIENSTMSWTFSDSYDNECNNNKILSNLKKMASENGTVDTDFVCHMLPIAMVVAIDVQYYDGCNLDNQQVNQSLSVYTYSSDINYWLEVIVPALVFIVILISVLLLLYWFCYKSSRRGRILLQSEKPTYLEERQPVIFQTESSAEDTMLQPKSPVIISHEDDDHRGLTGGGIEEQDVTLASSPEYNAPAMYLPPPYRLPPPYKSEHQFW